MTVGDPRPGRVEWVELQGSRPRRRPPGRVVEWDQASTPEIDDAGYRVEGGTVRIPTTPGFGLDLDATSFNAAVRDPGFVVAAE